VTIDFAVISASLDAATLVPQWLPGGKKQGREWVAVNPKRSDRNAGSFSVNLVTGKWADFAAGETGGDLVSLYAYLFHHNDQGAAARELSSEHSIRVDAASRQKVNDDVAVRKIDDAKPVPIFPIPVGAPAPDFKHFRFGEPTAVYTYRNAEGRELMHVVRFDPAHLPRKQVVPLSWCKDAKGVERWAWAGVRTGKRPLYGLERLARNPTGGVIVVEGEKAADAAQALLPEYVVVAWLGGTACADKIHLKPLQGRDVTLWPDFDAQHEKLTDEQKEAGMLPEHMPLLKLHEQPGMAAMMAIAQQLKGKASHLSLVGYTVGAFESGFDLADGWNGTDARAYLVEHAGDPWDIITGRKSKPAPGEEATLQFPSLTVGVNVHGWPDKGPKYNALGTLENTQFLMDYYGIVSRYNDVKKSVELHFPQRNYFGDNAQDCAFTELCSLCAKNMLPQSMLQAYVKNIANDNSYSPVRDWIESSPWDRRTRLPDLLGTLTTTPGNEALKDALVTRWLISAVAAAWRPDNFEAHGALVFTGPQGEGKTTWFRRLAPSAMGVIMVGASVDPADKDSVIKVVSHWIVELGELDATFRKADIARLKAFITSPVDKMRRPYDRIESSYQRSTVFGGSVNEERYLVDDTGNRRWWTVPVQKVDYLHTIDMQQLWAEVLTIYKGGAQWWLTKDETEQLNALNEAHEMIDPVREMILGKFDFEKNPVLRREQLSASDVLRMIGFDKPNKAQATHASKVLKGLTGAEPTRTARGRLFNMPPFIGRSRDDGSPF